jgi:hypothetical protein
MPESGPFGSVRGVCSNAHPYRDRDRSGLFAAFALLAATARQFDPLNDNHVAGLLAAVERRG